MTRLILILTAVLATSMASTAAGQVFEPTYEKVLVPVLTGFTPGAFGSRWTATVAVSNLSDTPVDVQGHGGGCRLGIPCRPNPIPPRTTVYVADFLISDVPASFLFVEPGRLDDLSITMRVFDESRAHLTWGATLPIVTRRELFAKPFGLGDIPVTDEFRSMLRLFDFDATTPAAVRVLVYRVLPFNANPPPDELLVELTPSFTVPFTGGGTDGHPGYASVPLWLLPELATADRVRIVIEPLDGSGDYWAMVSSTHNETQHVTVIAPR